MTLRQILKTEVRYWFPMVLVTYVFINGFLSGWSTWVVPDVDVPIKFNGDTLSYGVMFQRQIEGFWYFENTRFGYPFVSTLYDFPMSFLDVLTIKAIGFVAPAWYAIYTIYVVISFVVNALIGYAVMRAMGISIRWALVGAVLFNIVPFHFYRIGHIVFTIYVGIPLTYYMAWQLWHAHAHMWQRPHIIPTCVIGIVVGGYTIYYAIFALIIVLTTTGIVTWRERSVRVWWSGVAVMATIVFGMVIGLIPPLIHMLTDPNTIPLSRPVEDSVRYALWPIALFTLVPDTYLFGDTYTRVFGISWNEFQANSILGSLGIVLVLWGILSAWLNRPVAAFMRFLGFELGVLLIYCTVGGGGLVVSLLVTSIIRGTNRFAIFAMFIGIVALVWTLQQLAIRRQYSSRTITVLSSVVLLWGLAVDNPMVTNPFKYAPRAERVAAWQHETQFFRDVETHAGAGAAVYQLPALAFPEHDPDYRQTRCALYTTLRCSHGNAFGRDGALFYEVLAREPVPTQLAVLSRLGFTGVMIDRSYRAMRAVEDAWRTTLGSVPAIESSDGTMAYYSLPTPTGAITPGRTSADVIATAQFLQQEYALRTNPDVRIPIDLRKPWLPGSVKSITGIYELDVRGRWSNASDFRDVVVTMREPLPRTFTLTITALAWEQNINVPVTIVVGNQRQSVRFGATTTTNVLTFTTDGRANTITIIPAYRQQASANDARFLALLLEQIQITPQ